MTEVRRFADADELGRALAEEIVAAQPALLGCPGGRSLLTTYHALPPLPDTTIVMMDEYVPVPPPTAHWSCRGFAEREHGRAVRDVQLLQPRPRLERTGDVLALAGGEIVHDQHLVAALD